jgi:hypothetical protein
MASAATPGMDELNFTALNLSYAASDHDPPRFVNWCFGSRSSGYCHARVVRQLYARRRCGAQPLKVTGATR